MAGALLVALVLISGAALVFPAGQPVWENLLGPQDPGSVASTGTEPTPTDQGTPTETGATTATATVTATAEPADENDPPSADAGPDQTANGGDSVTLDGTATTDPDDEFDRLRFDWQQSTGPTVELVDADAASPTFTAPDVQTERQLQFVLNVTDPDGANDTDVVNVTVQPTPPEDLPTVTATGANQTDSEEGDDSSDHRDPGEEGDSPTHPESGEGGTELDDCTVIDEPGQYVLSGDIENAEAATCVRIESSDVHLDGAGHTLDGTDAHDSIGVLATGTEEVPLTNVTVRNLTVTDWATGVEYQWTNDGELSGVTATSNDRGVQLRSSSDNRVTRNDLVENSRAGLVLRGSGSHYNTIDRNEVNDNGKYGIHLVDSRQNQLSANAALDNGEWDYYSSDRAEDNTVERLELSTATVSFDASDVAIRAVEHPPTDPDGYQNIGQFVESTGTDADAWLELTVHYADSDVREAGVDESSLRLWRYDDAWEELPPPNEVDTEAKTVTANVTRFDGVAVFAPLGAPAEREA